MKPIEQVLFRVRHAASKRDVTLLAATDGVARPDLAEIADWFSAPPDEMILRFDLATVFFHPLPLGAYLIGLIGPEEPDLFSIFQPPEAFFVHGLIVPAETLLRAGNHPIALLDRLRREGLAPTVIRPQNRLEPLRPSLPDKVLDTVKLNTLFQRIDPAAFVALLQSLSDALCTVFESGIATPSLSVLSALFDFLPILERTELTFSSTFFFSRQNPFRLVASGENAGATQVPLAQMLDLPFFSFDKTKQRQATAESVLLADPWPRLVYRILKTRNCDFWEQSLRAELATLIAKPWGDVPLFADWDGLHRKAALWSDCLENGEPAPFSFTDEGPLALEASASAVSLEAQRCFAALEHTVALLEGEQDGSRHREGELHETLERYRRERPAPSKAEPPVPHAPPHAEAVAAIDSHFARALFGDHESLTLLRRDWNALKESLPRQAGEALRESYLDLLRRILTLPSGPEPRDPERSVSVLDLLLLFLEDDPPAG